jgi:hypothetical protein
MDISSLCYQSLKSRKLLISAATGLFTCLLMSAAVSAAPTKFNHFRSSGSNQGGAVQVAALSERESGDKHYLVRRPDREGDNYISVVLKDMMKSIEPGGNRNELIFKLGYATPGQKALYAVYLMQNEVALGGFKSYFKSNAANLVNEARKGLKLIKAYRYLNLLEDALVLFVDDEEMLDTAFDRKNFLETVPDKVKYRVFEATDSKFESLENDDLLKGMMVSYINKHPGQFFLN